MNVQEDNHTQTVLNIFGPESASFVERLTADLRRFGVVKIDIDAIGHIAPENGLFGWDWQKHHATHDPKTTQAVEKVRDALLALEKAVDEALEIANAESIKQGQLNVAAIFKKTTSTLVKEDLLDLDFNALHLAINESLETGIKTKKGRPQNDVYDYFIATMGEICCNHTLRRKDFIDILIATDWMIDAPYRTKDEVQVGKRIDTFASKKIEKYFSSDHHVVEWFAQMHRK